MEELTDTQVQELTEQLHTLRDELQQQLDSSADAAKPVTLDQSAVGRLSRIDAIQQQKMAEASRRNMQVRLSQCSAALQAVERKEFGDCRACDEPIGFRRLNARPESPFCVACQSKMGR